VRGELSTKEAKVSQFRAVTGIKGNLPFLKNSDWKYEAYLSFSRSFGRENFWGIRGDKLQHSLKTTRWDPKNPDKLICGNGSDGCVVVNLFAPSLYKEGGGNFATKAEHDYLFGNRWFETIIKQKMAGVTIDGSVFSLPWNDTEVPLVIGYEHREDYILSTPSRIAAEGLFSGMTIKDKGATGSTHHNDIFAETGLHLLQGQTMAEELSISGAVRYTKPELYDGSITYNVKMVYRPVEWVTLRGTYGVSYRAPNLREQFLERTKDISLITDPCVVPYDARNGFGLGATYNAKNDSRSDQVKKTCRGRGIDPTSFGLNMGDPNSFYLVKSISGGTDTVKEESSKSFTYGIVLEQPWSDDFKLIIGATYYDIEVRNTIEDMSAIAFLSSCHNSSLSAEIGKLYCDRIKRNSSGKILSIDARPMNIGLRSSRGIDFNLAYEQEFLLGSRSLGVSFGAKASYLIESSESLVATKKGTNLAGIGFFPSWRINGSLGLEYDDFQLTWSSQWMQGTKSPVDGIYHYGGPCFNNNATKGVKCRSIYSTKNFITHTASLSWMGGADYSVTLGVSNIFNTQPLKVDGLGPVPSSYNYPLGMGYDPNGRTIFVNATKKF
jgi:iron complex outermembrane receptor protein